MGIQSEGRNVTDIDLFENIDVFQKTLDNFKLEFESAFVSNVLNNIEYKTVKLNDKPYFNIYTTCLGKTKKEYSLIDTKNIQDIPIYTAAKSPVAFIKEIEGVKPIQASINNKYISFATDGDGTAGTNIFLHESRFYMNTSRFCFEIIDKNIIPEYVFYYIQDIKKKYEFNYKNKANQTNITQIEIKIPIINGKFCKISQEKFISKYQEISNVKDKIMNNFFNAIGDFKSDINNQLSLKIKDYFNIED